MYVVSCKTYVFYQKFIDLPSGFALYSKCLSMFCKYHLGANACPDEVEGYHIVILVSNHSFEGFFITNNPQTTSTPGVSGEVTMVF